MDSNESKKLINDLTEIQDLYYVSMMLLCSYSDDKNKIPELALITNKKSFLNIIEYFGGKTIKIPTKQELNKVLKSIQVYYYYNIKYKEWNEISNILEIQDINKLKEYNKYAVERLQMLDIKDFKIRKDIDNESQEEEKDYRDAYKECN